MVCSDVPAAAVDLIASRRNRCRPLLQNAPSLFLSQLLHCPSSAKMLNMKKTVQRSLVVDHLHQYYDLFDPTPLFEKCKLQDWCFGASLSSIRSGGAMHVTLRRENLEFEL